MRNGYPYATLTGHSEKSGISRAVSSISTARDFVDTAEERAVAELASDVAEALEGLKQRSLELAAE